MSNSDEFSSPAAATGIQWASYEGRLLLFTVNAVESDINTRFGNSDAVRATVDVLDGPDEGEGYADTLVFPKVLQAQLRPSVGGRVLGRLTKGNAKPGQNPAWRLDDPTEDDKAVARKFIAEHYNKPDKPPF